MDCAGAQETLNQIFCSTVDGGNAQSKAQIALHGSGAGCYDLYLCNYKVAGPQVREPDSGNIK